MNQGEKKERRITSLKLFTEGKTMDEVYLAMLNAYPDLPINKKALQEWYDKEKPKEAA